MERKATANVIIWYRNIWRENDDNCWENPKSHYR